MSERYSRLYSLPGNLYAEDSPVLIVAGALLKDNQTGKILSQFKFRNISNKAIKSVKIKVNAYDTAKEKLNGIEAFSYLDLSIAANEEFGQSTPIHLPDTTTRSVSVEILSVVYADNEVYSPKVISETYEAPKEILETVQHAEDLRQAKIESIKLEQLENKKRKQCQQIMIFAFVSIVFVVISFVINF